MSAERFLVTGAYGCIGAWVVRQLVREGVPVVTYDLAPEPARLRLLLDADELARVVSVPGDITDIPALERTLDAHGITRVVHLAALQVPFCRADPPLGAAVNVVGTVNVLEAAARRLDCIPSVAYASSVAVYDTHGSPDGAPDTLYGVFKQADERAARVYWQDRGVASIGLRPHTVYGVGRDQGLTSAPTVAMLAAAAGVPYRLPFGGRLQLQYAPDVAAAFVAAARSTSEGASVHNLAGEVSHVDEIVEAILAAAPQAVGLIGSGAEALPFPERVDAGSLPAEMAGRGTPLFEGVADTVRRFRALLESGALAAPLVDA